MAQAALKLEEPKVELLSKAAIAKLVKLHVQTVSSRLEDLGYEPDPSSTAKNQLYPFDDEMKLAIMSAKDTLSAVRIRELRARAEKVEMQNAEARGDLVPYGESVERMQAVLTKLYKETALQMPKTLASRIAKSKSKTAADIQKLVKLEVGRIFAKLQESGGDFVPDVK